MKDANLIVKVEPDGTIIYSVKLSCNLDLLPDAKTLLSGAQSIFGALQKAVIQDKETQRDDTIQFVTVKEACKLLGVTRSTLYRYEKNGVLHPSRIGADDEKKHSHVMYSVAEINAVLEQCRTI